MSAKGTVLFRDPRAAGREKCGHSRVKPSGAPAGHTADVHWSGRAKEDSPDFVVSPSAAAKALMAGHRHGLPSPGNTVAAMDRNGAFQGTMASVRE